MANIIISLVRLCFQLYSWALIIYALLSWMPGGYDSKLGQFIVKIVRPYLDFFNRYIPSFGGISINVLIALLVLRLVERGLMSILFFFLR